MKRLICLIMAAMMCISGAAAMGFRDAKGRWIDIEKCGRTAALYKSYGDAWVSAGGRLVGSIADGFDDGGLGEGVQNLGSYREPNLEMLFALEPELVLLSADVASHEEIGRVLEAAGVEYAYFSTPDYESYMAMMEIFCELNGREDIYAAQVEKVQRPIEEMIAEAEKLEKPTALLIRANSTTVKCKGSEGTVAGNILRDMGFVNLADGKSALCESISMEAVLVEDPEYIFVVLQGSSAEAAEKNLGVVLTDNPAWSTLRAVEEGRFYVLDRELFHYHPNERWAEAYGYIMDIRRGER